MRITEEITNEAILRELGERIRDRRIAMPMTQKELAEAAGISLRTVAHIESGDEVKAGNLLNVLRALRLLGNIEILVPAQGIRPSDLMRLGKKRKRAVSKEKKRASEWQWGDEA